MMVVSYMRSLDRPVRVLVPDFIVHGVARVCESGGRSVPMGIVRLGVDATSVDLGLLEFECL